MYEWIWRKLPFGLPGKIVGSALLLAAAIAILWFWVFPAAEPLLPFDEASLRPGNVEAVAAGIDQRRYADAPLEVVARTAAHDPGDRRQPR